MPKSYKVLIVEDDKFILKAIRYKFEEAKFNVKTSQTAEGGLTLLEKWTPNAIILDILLPGIDGYAFLRTVRNHPKWSTIPVIVASNINEPPDIEPGENTGYKEYIVKSDLDLNSLVEKVKTLAR
ncbi:MAG: response regulator [Candidatus Levybacteria bacterium]|nr:response regulator [Candidatus Levybacteria bacterium]